MSAQSDFDALDLSNNDNPAVLRRFIDAHRTDAPGLVAAVEERLTVIEADRRERALKLARDRDSIIQYRNYLQTYGSQFDPDGVWQAFHNRIRELETLDDEAFAEARATDTVKAYRGYLKGFPEGRHRGEAEKEVGKRFELLRALFVRTDGEGGTQPRWLVIILLLPLMVVTTGIAGLLVLGVFGLVFGSFGTTGLGIGLIAFFATIYLVVRYGLGRSAEDAWIAPVVIGLTMLLVLLVGTFLGLM